MIPYPSPGWVPFLRYPFFQEWVMGRFTRKLYGLVFCFTTVYIYWIFGKVVYNIYIYIYIYIIPGCVNFILLNSDIKIEYEQFTQV